MRFKCTIDLENNFWIDIKDNISYLTFKKSNSYCTESFYSFDEAIRYYKKYKDNLEFL